MGCRVGEYSEESERIHRPRRLARDEWGKERLSMTQWRVLCRRVDEAVAEDDSDKSTGGEAEVIVDYGRGASLRVANL